MSQPLPNFVAARQGSWAELGALLDGSRGSPSRLDALAVRRLGRLYREVVADLAYARRAYPRDPVTTQLEQLVGRARPLLYGTASERESVGHYCTTGYWRRVRERPVTLLVAAVAWIVPALGMAFWSHEHPSRAREVAQISPLTAGIGDEDGARDPDTEKLTDVGEATDLSGSIFTNNARVALLAFAGGLTGGLLTLFSLVFNGLILGLVAGLVIETGQSETLWRLIIPHGVLELSLLTAAAAGGLRVGWALVHPGHRTRGQALSDEGRPGLELAVGSAALLVPCGLVEGFVTTRGLTTPSALAVGFGLGTLYWGLVLWRGRPERPAVTDVPAT